MKEKIKQSLVLIGFILITLFSERVYSQQSFYSADTLVTAADTLYLPALSGTTVINQPMEDYLYQSLAVMADTGGVSNTLGKFPALRVQYALRAFDGTYLKQSTKDSVWVTLTDSLTIADAGGELFMPTPMLTAYFVYRVMFADANPSAINAARKTYVLMSGKQTK